MQIHNLVDWEVHYKTLRQWKEEGKIRYIGITHYTEGAYGSIEQILKTTPLDFLQINYSLLSRSAEERLFPLAQEKKVAVIINQPFEEGALFSRVKGKTLPVWAKEFDCSSWGQFFLKFILAQPAVTCVIPGTSKPHHMLDNLHAALGKLPSESQRKQMLSCDKLTLAILYKILRVKSEKNCSRLVLDCLSIDNKKSYDTPPFTYKLMIR